jgi:hypothetical protein
MLMLFTVIGLALITLFTVVLQKTYGQTAPKEMKRRAQSGDATAAVLYRAVAYGISLKVLLWAVIALSTAGLFYVLAQGLPLLIALVAMIALFVAGFVWLPNTKATKASYQLARFVTPTIAWVLNYLHTPLQAIGMFVSSHSNLARHSQLYQKEDLIDLLEQQQQITGLRKQKLIWPFIR